MNNINQLATAIANRQRVLEAMPGTAAQLCDRTKLAQPTVSKLLRSLIKVGKAYQSGWSGDGGPASAVFSQGKLPAGFRLPEKPARMSRDEYNARRKLSRMASEERDELPEHWPKLIADPIPEQHPLMLMFNSVALCSQPEYCRINAPEDYGNKSKCEGCTLRSVKIEGLAGDE